MERENVVKGTYIGLITASLVIMIALYIVFTFSIIHVNMVGMVLTIICMIIDSVMFGVLIVMYREEFDDDDGKNKKNNSESGKGVEA